MEGSSRPAWGCLDAQEMREAAAGHPQDPAIDEHLSGCADCRRMVRELHGDRRRSRRREGSSGRRSLLARPGFWLLLLLLALLGYGALVLLRRKPRETEKTPPASSEVQPAPTPAPRPPVRRPRAARRPAGGADNAAILAVIRNNQTGVRMCYERALKREPRLAARLQVHVNISAGGVVEQVALGGLADGGMLAGCIRNVIKTWHFPTAPAAYEAEFPLRLQQTL